MAVITGGFNVVSQFSQLQLKVTNVAVVSGFNVVSQFPKRVSADVN